jgi:hypothetical protein
MSKSQPSRPDNPNRPNTKRTGERSEAAFLYQASQRRFAICKPWGDSERYDFILDNRPQPKVHLFRIQIKCTLPPRRSLRNARYLHPGQAPRRLHQTRHRFHSRPRSPSEHLVHNPGRSLHPPTHAPLLPPPQSKVDAPRKIPRSLAPARSPTPKSPPNYPSLHRRRLPRRSRSRKPRPGDRSGLVGQEGGAVGWRSASALR